MGCFVILLLVWIAFGIMIIAQKYGFNTWPFEIIINKYGVIIFSCWGILLAIWLVAKLVGWREVFSWFKDKIQRKQKAGDLTQEFPCVSTNYEPQKYATNGSVPEEKIETKPAEKTGETQYIDLTLKDLHDRLRGNTNMPKTNEETAINHIRRFKPRWRYKDGKRKLEGGENGNNANLAQYLRRHLGCKVETEETLINGSRVDLIIGGEIILECKPHLKSMDMLNSLVTEVKRVKQLGRYKAYAVIYGDARRELHRELANDIGETSIILLGKLLDSKFGDD